MNLNNKGFTLVEILAIIIILSTLAIIMVPSVNYLIEQNKVDNYKSLESSIINAAKVYISDNRYNITLKYGPNLCGTGETEEDISKILTNNLIDSKLPIKVLIDSKDLSTNNEKNIINPKTNEILDLENSYILVKYQCSTKDYIYTLEENSLIWK